MRQIISVRKLHEDNSEDFIENPEERLDLVEILRLEAGKFLYEYPTTFRRVIKVIRRRES
jgi:hypothetical protein